MRAFCVLVFVLGVVPAQSLAMPGEWISGVTASALEAALKSPAIQAIVLESEFTRSIGAAALAETHEQHPQEDCSLSLVDEPVVNASVSSETTRVDFQSTVHVTCGDASGSFHISGQSSVDMDVTKPNPMIKLTDITSTDAPAESMAALTDKLNGVLSRAITDHANPSLVTSIFQRVVGPAESSSSAPLLMDLEAHSHHHSKDTHKSEHKSKAHKKELEADVKTEHKTSEHKDTKSAHKTSEHKDTKSAHKTSEHKKAEHKKHEASQHSSKSEHKKDSHHHKQPHKLEADESHQHHKNEHHHSHHHVTKKTHKTGGLEEAGSVWYYKFRFGDTGDYAQVFTNDKTCGKWLGILRDCYKATDPTFKAEGCFEVTDVAYPRNTWLTAHNIDYDLVSGSLNLKKDDPNSYDLDESQIGVGVRDYSFDGCGYPGQTFIQVLRHPSQESEPTAQEKSSGGSPQCLPAHTHVTTPHGTIPLSSVRVGDRLLSRDAATGRTVFSKVTAWLHRHAKARNVPYVTLHTGGNTSLTVSARHMVFDPTQGYVFAEAAKALCELPGAVGDACSHVTVTGVSPEPANGLYAPLTEHGTFYASTGATDPAVLVHSFAEWEHTSVQYVEPMVHGLVWAAGWVHASAPVGGAEHGDETEYFHPVAAWAMWLTGMTAEPQPLTKTLVPSVTVAGLATALHLLVRRRS